MVDARGIDSRTAYTGYGLETELADPDPELVTAAASASDAIEALLRPLMALGKRLEALIEDPPDWLDGQARARVDGARHSLGTRIDTLRSEEHTSELQSLMRISYAVFCLKKKNKIKHINSTY